MLTEVRIGKTVLRLVDGDIADQDTDAVVTAAHWRLNKGTGTDGTIHTKGGPRIYEECCKIGGCPIGDAAVYESAGFAFLCLPIPDGHAPTMEQAPEFVRFVNEQRKIQRPVAVHCEAGLGRTGTMLAVYLIAQGQSAVDIRRDRDGAFFEL